ncbi:magnesium transporter [Inmirania thermothiophila]|uniref:Magnesium transporter MgtE n=1 Tax=Inmirania thermothiophila TaxID=1750597 RepID=A0A3N1XSY0_9GAMM|nr:magnesium transporter [Inmirania thermothiophila]ROR29750.1 magnesium transporter [Inmirania thermothiophila]
MAEPAETRTRTAAHLEALTQALETGTLRRVARMLNALPPAEIARLLESLPPPQRAVVWELVDESYDGDVLAELNDEVRATLLEDMEAEEVVAALEGLDPDDLADILQDLPDTVIRQVLASMDQENRRRLEAVLSYPEDTAGGLMNTDTVTVRADVTLDVVLRYLRMRGEIPELTDSLFVVDRNGRYLGVLPLTALLTRDPILTVAEVMEREPEGIPATTPATEVAQLFQHRDLVSAAVVDERGRLLGRITVDDVVDVIREEADQALLSMAGLDEEDDMFAPVPVSYRRRALWLGVNLATAFLASWVVGLFQDTIDQVVALAVLMPIVASMGGIAGSQTLTLAIRGIALGQVSSANAAWLLTKELLVGLLNGMTWAVVVGLIAWFWFDNTQIAAVIAAAIIINLICAAFAGLTIPLALRRMGIDPALAGSMALTTVTDVVGFFAFLGLASLYLA